MLVQTVLEQFPHPDQNVRVSWSQVQDVDLGPQLLRRLMRVLIPFLAMLSLLMTVAGVPSGRDE